MLNETSEIVKIGLNHFPELNNYDSNEFDPDLFLKRALAIKNHILSSYSEESRKEFSLLILTLTAIKIEKIKSLKPELVNQYLREFGGIDLQERILLHSASALFSILLSYFVFKSPNDINFYLNALAPLTSGMLSVIISTFIEETIILNHSIEVGQKNYFSTTGTHPLSLLLKSEFDSKFEELISCQLALTSKISDD